MKTFTQNDKQNLIITCASGVERTVKTELNRLGYECGAAVNGGITLSADSLAVARCNVNLRCADRVYIKIAEFGADTFDQLFDGVYSLPWADYLPSDAKIVVNGKCVKSKIFAISACQSIVKKAIVKCLTKKYSLNSLPETGGEYGVEFSLFKDVATIMLNTSGAGLHKRGYRDLVGIAPIKETLASALLLMSDFYHEKPFADPFCGSGTLVIEGAKIALNIPANLERKFAFNGWKNFDKKLYQTALEEGLDKRCLNRKIDFCGSDIDAKAISLAKRHAQRAGLLDKVKFLHKPVKDFVPNSPIGTIVTNPPYGERVYDKIEAEECYRDLGKALKKYPEWSVFAITSAKSFPKYFGRKPDRERKLYNSNKECKFYYYYAKKENKDG